MIILKVAKDLKVNQYYFSQFFTPRMLIYYIVLNSRNFMIEPGADPEIFQGGGG